jgi:nucleolysin TIA-1/TIAR
VNTIFVGDIPIFTKDRDLEGLFCTFGQILDVKVKQSVKNGKSLAYGFVTFSDQTEAQEAMTRMEGVVFCDRRLR